MAGNIPYERQPLPLGRVEFQDPTFRPGRTVVVTSPDLHERIATLERRLAALEARVGTGAEP